MSEALEKAKGALQQIKDINEGEFDGSNPKMTDLLALARIQCDLAQTAALESIADTLGRFYMDSK